MAEDPRITAQQIVAQFRARGAQPSSANSCVKGGTWLHVCRNKVADGLHDRVLSPHHLNQFNTNICGVAAFVRQWIKDDPIGFVWLGISLFENGHGVLGRGKYHGKDIKPSPDLRNSTIPNSPIKDKPGFAIEMNHGDWIVMASIREAFNGVFNYSADEGPFAIKAWNFPSEVVATFRAAGYTNVIDDTDWKKNKGYESLMQASTCFKHNYRVVLLINARMLDDETLDTQAFFPTSDHWVGLQSPINLSVVGSEYRVSQFNVFSWGGEQKVPKGTAPVPLEKLLKNYYGYIAAKY